MFAATLAILALPLPFLVRTSLIPACTIHSKAAPTLPSVVAGFSIALGCGVLLAAFAIFARTRLAHSSMVLEHTPQ